MVEVVVWSLAYSIVDAAPADANLTYFAFVNYTNGALLIGWSTAVIFEVLRRALLCTEMPKQLADRLMGV